MSLDGSKYSPQREQTNESLRVEREQFDGVLAEAHTSDEESADRALQLAREKADAVLVASRERADQRTEEALQRTFASGASIAEDRLNEDLRLQRARETADAALSIARERADQLLEQAASRAVASSVRIAEERLLEDKTRRNERTFADNSLRREREDNARVLAKLLPLEREKTDRYLLTERERSDAALSVRDDFLAMVSHDLRSLLGGIVMCTDLLSANAPDSEAGRVTMHDTASIQRYAARMNRLIGDLVDVVSIEAGKLSVITVPCDAAALLGEVTETFLATAHDKGIELGFERPEGPLLAELDCERMMQVLANLVTNAIKFTARGGSIQLRGWRSGSELHFSVRDSGAGIPAHMLEAIFERFWQAGRDDRRGLGLGLYISRCIVEAHGGRIWAESTPGEGSALCFTLTAAAKPRSLAPPSMPTA